MKDGKRRWKQLNGEEFGIALQCVKNEELLLDEDESSLTFNSIR
jgi:hypothetical protein